jgi:hypothetical protein
VRRSVNGFRLVLPELGVLWGVSVAIPRAVLPQFIIAILYMESLTILKVNDKDLESGFGSNLRAGIEAIYRTE